MPDSVGSDLVFQLCFTQGVGITIIIPILQIRRQGEVESFVQATTDNTRLSWGRNPERLALEIRFFTVYFPASPKLGNEQGRKKSASGLRPRMVPEHDTCSINESYYWPF